MIADIGEYEEGIRAMHENFIAASCAIDDLMEGNIDTPIADIFSPIFKFGEIHFFHKEDGEVLDMVASIENVKSKYLATDIAEREPLEHVEDMLNTLRSFRRELSKINSIKDDLEHVRQIGVGVFSSLDSG